MTDRRASCSTQPSQQEILDVLRMVFKDHGLVEFHSADPQHWRRALHEFVQRELATHLAAEDHRYVNAALHLTREAGKRTPVEWHELLQKLGVSLEIDTTHGVRCPASHPLQGYINEGDPENAPVHGTIARYNSPKFQCRCTFCKRAQAEYRRERREASFRQEALNEQTPSDHDCGSRGDGEGYSSEDDSVASK